jgi:hypothetical protein
MARAFHSAGKDRSRATDNPGASVGAIARRVEIQEMGACFLDVLLCETVRDKIAARLFVDPSGVSVLRPFIYARHLSDAIMPVIAASK